MAITQENLDELKKFERRTVAVNKDAFRLNVAKPQRNLELIVGRVLSPKFFSRQTKWIDEFPRRNILARFLDITACIYFADAERGERFIEFVESFFAYLRATRAEKQTASDGDFWELEEEQTVLTSTRRKAFAKGDKQTAREISIKIQHNEKTMPQFLKRADGGKMKRKRGEKSVERKVKTNAAR